MADHYVGVNRGKQSGMNMADLSFDTSTTSTDLELRIADAAGWTRLEVVEGLMAFIRALEEPSQSTFPKI